MAYPVISSHRIPYDIDGTKVGLRSNAGSSNTAYVFDKGVGEWLTSEQIGNLNSSGFRKQDYPPFALWFFFPEKVEVEGMALKLIRSDPTYAGNYVLQGSNNTTNGLDGVWEQAIFTKNHGLQEYDWRARTMSISFSSPYKSVRLGFVDNNYWAYIDGVYFYGRKAISENPDDILFCDTLGDELTALTEWGDRPEGTTAFKQIKVKNSSPSKIANYINLQLNHADFLISWNPDGPWVATLDIQSLGPGALSGTVYLKNQLAPPLLMLGPKAARIIASVGSWT